MVFIVPKSKSSRFIPVTVQRMSSTTWIIRFVRVDVALHFSNTFPGLAKIEKGIDSLPRADTDNRLTDDLTYILMILMAIIILPIYHTMFFLTCFKHCLYAKTIKRCLKDVRTG